MLSSARFSGVGVQDSACQGMSVYVHILSDSLKKQAQIPASCCLWSVMDSQWPTETLMGTMDSCHLWVYICGLEADGGARMQGI